MMRNRPMGAAQALAGTISPAVAVVLKIYSLHSAVVDNRPPPAMHLVEVVIWKPRLPSAYWMGWMERPRPSSYIEKKPAKTAKAPAQLRAHLPYPARIVMARARYPAAMGYSILIRPADVAEGQVLP